jgi:hypothetical protein
MRLSTLLGVGPRTSKFRTLYRKLHDFHLSSTFLIQPMVIHGITRCSMEVRTIRRTVYQTGLAGQDDRCAMLSANPHLT